MPIIQFGPWRPDAAAVDIHVTVNIKNIAPQTHGFGPIGSPASATTAVPGTDDIVGASQALAQDGSGASFVGTLEKLWRLSATNDWDDVSRTAGGDYITPVGERWRFAQFINIDTVGDLIIGTNAVDVPQKYDLTSSTNFEALGGTPGEHRYISTFGQRVLLANKTGASPVANRLSFSAVQDPEVWDGTNLSGFQDITPGGPITGLTSGEVAYVFQRNRISRVINRPDDDTLKIQIDGMEERRGLEADNSLTEYGELAFFLSQDGFYMLDKRSGKVLPIGDEKVDRFFLGDVRANTRLSVLGSVSPASKAVFWSYISIDNSGNIPDRVIIFDWGRGEWGSADVSVLALSAFITTGFTLDELDPFGTLDTLPFSLDNAFWAGGETILGFITEDRRLSNLTGAPLAAQIDTQEGTFDQDIRGRVYISGVAPIINTDQATFAIGHRDRVADQVVFDAATAMEADGFCPQHIEANLVSGRLVVPAGTPWSLAQGFDPMVEVAGEF